eukprot:10098799-Alexandrium_andersonii.AAC.1
MKSQRRNPAPPRRSQADRRRPLKPSPGREVQKGLVRKVLGEEVRWILRSVDSQQLVGHQLLEVQVLELNAIGLPAAPDP